MKILQYFQWECKQTIVSGFIYIGAAWQNPMPDLTICRDSKYVFKRDYWHLQHFLLRVYFQGLCFSYYFPPKTDLREPLLTKTFIFFPCFCE